MAMAMAMAMSMEDVAAIPITMLLASQKCIETVAALECGRACQDDPGHEKSLDHPHEHENGDHRATSACSTHLQAAFDQYSSYLEQLRCICRSVIDQGAASLETCCMGNNRPSAAKKTRHKLAGDEHEKHRGNTAVAVTTTTTSSKASGNGAEERPKGADPEKTGGVETVGFLVSGMDCTSCADKLMRVLGAATGVSQPQVNFVSGKGEFDVDTSVADADGVIRFAAAASGFALSRIAGGDHFLLLLASPAEGERLAADPPRGVTDVESLDKKTVRLAYDPAAIGARDLFALVEDRCGGLARPRGDPQLENGRRRLRDQLAKTALAAALTIPVAVLAWDEGLVDDRTGGIVSLVLGTLVQAVAVPEFYRPALSALWYSGVVEMDMLVVMSITAAYVYSVVAFGFDMAGGPLDEGHFFETSTMLVTLILAGRLVAAFARVRAVAAVSLRSKQNNTAVLVGGNGDREIDARLLQYDDRFRVLPHSRVPTDGVVVSGRTEVDESMLTGESLPIVKEEGDSLIAGTVNGDGTVVARLTRLPGKNTVTDIARLVEEAAGSKPELQGLADKVAGWFVPAMAAVAVLAFVVWVAVGIRVLGYSAGKSVGNAVTYAVAALAVACPCALGLAVPMVLVVAGGIAAREGVVIKSADTTEGARKTTDVVFDKTGTITEAELTVVEQVNLQGDADENLTLAKALVAGGKHPVSAAVGAHLDRRGVTPASGIADVRVVPGAGVEADRKGSSLRAGNARWTDADSDAEVARLQQAGLTALVVARDSAPLVVFGLAVRIRPEAPRVIAELQARGIAVHLVSGDQTVAVEAVAAAVGIPAERVAGERTPPEKRDYVSALMGDGARHVLFCGDGTNDAVAVAQANVGVQIGGGSGGSSDVTQGAADVVLMSGLEGIPFLLDISGVAFRRMAFNFVWSGVYNVLAVTMASGAWVRFRIPPAYAGLGEVVSVLPVILAAMSMLLVRLRK
ncbi:heavy metal translocating P-type ATPase [Colletotrichum navitas]|uniref:Heavy metal translocating P-type ATPase n=1 Tax=Colletotrichum navitas TaxID=681940 RepID=A0AAD8UWR8_9PEZI|nr:heavy metal translocating P-type ATPase [Colletotrichum navitas]KAK1564204.1 heavy metal translocating P-type ATPase [Colletotrichum navitas]